MDDLDRPPLGEVIYKEIEAALNKIDASYWQELRVLRGGGDQIGLPRGALQETTPPERSLHLRTAFNFYAVALFNEEASHYPLDPLLGRWLEKLAERIRDRVMKTVATIEAIGLSSHLSYRGLTEAQKHATISDALRNAKQIRLQKMASEPLQQAQPTSLMEEKGPTYTSLPGATIYGVCPDSNEFVAWNGYSYELRPTKESVLADDSLRLIGSVRELLVDAGWVGKSGQVGVVRMGTATMAATAAPEPQDTQQDDPQRWSPLRRAFEAFREMKKIITGPRERIPESLVRKTLAQQYGIKPEEVTWKQIQFEVAGLLSAHRAIELIPSLPTSEFTSQQESMSEMKERQAARRGVKKRATVGKRDTVIFAAILLELTGPRYCSFLQEHELKPKWSDQGPASYPKSYQAGEPWRKKVQDEKTRARSRMSRHLDSELADALNIYLPGKFGQISSLLHSRNSRDARKTRSSPNTHKS